MRWCCWGGGGGQESEAHRLMTKGLPALQHRLSKPNVTNGQNLISIPALHFPIWLHCTGWHLELGSGCIDLNYAICPYAINWSSNTFNLMGARQKLHNSWEHKLIMHLSGVHLREVHHIYLIPFLPIDSSWHFILAFLLLWSNIF